jgi:hypothetical protein
VNAWDALHERAKREPINVDISDFSDEWCLGFRAGQCNVLEEIEAGRLTLPPADESPPSSAIERPRGTR